jgi:hypothetical protein
VKTWFVRVERVDEYLALGETMEDATDAAILSDVCYSLRVSTEERVFAAPASCAEAETPVRVR